MCDSVLLRDFSQYCDFVVEKSPVWIRISTQKDQTPHLVFLFGCFSGRFSGVYIALKKILRLRRAAGLPSDFIFRIYTLEFFIAGTLHYVLLRARYLPLGAWGLILTLTS